MDDPPVTQRCIKVLTLIRNYKMDFDTSGSTCILLSPHT